jgi:hypothetical protein
MFPGGPGFARMAAVAVAGASSLLVAACGGASASSLSTAPSASSTPDPLASLPAGKVAAEAMANFKAASSLTMTGTFNDSGTNVAVNLGFKPGHGCAGMVGLGSEGSVKLIVIGKTIYFDPPAQYWQGLGSEASALIARVDGRYIKTSTSVSGVSSVASVCDLSRQMASAKVTGILIKGKLTTLGGTRVLPILDPPEGVLYVTDTSKPEIAEIVETKNSGDGTAKVTLSVGAPVTLTAPPASQVINGSAIGM